MQNQSRLSLFLRFAGLVSECVILATEKRPDEFLEREPVDDLLSECVLAIREKLTQRMLDRLKSVGTPAPETGDGRVFHDDDRRSDYETSQELKEELIRLGVIYDRRHGREIHQPWPKAANDAGELKRRIEGLEGSLRDLRQRLDLPPFEFVTGK